MGDKDAPDGGAGKFDSVVGEGMLSNDRADAIPSDYEISGRFCLVFEF